MVASVGRITAGAGYDYLTREVASSKHDYYVGAGEAPGVWTGRGAHLLGLSGEVQADEMEALFGRFVVPSTVGGTRLPSGRWVPEEVLGRRVSTRYRVDGTAIEPLAALDVTFSPSKSVSVLWALSSDTTVRKAVVAAHDEAVAFALEYLDAHAGHARVGAGGLRRIGSGGFVIAQFRHRTARSTAPGVRPGDPQLHTHCAILNRVRGEDGVWRTLDSRAIYRHAHAAGSVYAATLEQLLTERLAVGWEAPAERVPMREITGIPAELRARFSTRRAAVLDTYERLEAEWRNEFGRSPTRTEAANLRAEATVRSRHVKSRGVDDLHARWRSMASETELNAIDQLTARPSLLVSDGGRLEPGSEHLAATVFAQLEGQRSWWTRAHLTAEIARWSTDTSLEAIEVETERFAARCVALEADHDPTYAEPNATKLTSQRLLDAEHRVINAFDEPASFTVPATVDPRLGDDHATAVRAMTESDRRVIAVIGPAGAGKTTLLRATRNATDLAGREMAVLCLSAAAARVVTEEVGIAADTIASWQHGQTTLPDGGLVVIDEASMVPTLTLDQLITNTRRVGSRLVLVGDYAQMGAPEAGGLLRDIAALPTSVHMTSVHRFQHGWERDATIRLRNNDPTVVDDYHTRGRLHAVWADAAIDELADAWYTDLVAGHDTLVVVDTNATATEASAACQQRLLDARRLTGPVVATAADGNPLFVGDLIQTRRNTNRLATSDRRRVLNRDTWTITAATADGGVQAAHTRTGTTVTITPDYLGEHVVLGYATTIAGAQGRTVDRSHVLVTPTTTASALYVGMTRGRDTNTAHVVADGHDHRELQLGERAAPDAFRATMRRWPEGAHSATTVAANWSQQHAARDAARHADQISQQLLRVAAWLDCQPTIIQRDLRPHVEQIADVLARLPDDRTRRQHLNRALVCWNRHPRGERAAGFLHTLTTGEPPQPSATITASATPRRSRGYER